MNKAVWKYHKYRKIADYILGGSMGVISLFCWIKKNRKTSSVLLASSVAILINSLIFNKVYKNIEGRSIKNSLEIKKEIEKNYSKKMRRRKIRSRMKIAKQNILSKKEKIIENKQQIRNRDEELTEILKILASKKRGGGVLDQWIQEIEKQQNR